MTKIDIYSGFLGAGKTTLIKKMIAQGYTGQKLVLIENEFGEIGIDGGFLQEAGIEIREMNSGCICCSLVGDFGKALEQVVAQYAPDRVIIEPSGVGKLSDVVAAVEKVPGTELGYTVAVADAGKCKVYMRNFGEFYNNQIESASTIVLSRTDTIPQEKLDAAVALLRTHNDRATMVTTPWNQLTGQQLIDAMEHRQTLAEELAMMVHEREEQAEGHDHEHHCHHDQYKKQGAGPHPKKQPGAGCFYSKSHGFHSRVKERMHQSVSGKDRQEDSAQIPHSAEHDGKEHDRQKEPYQPDQLSHDPDTAAPA